MRNSCCRECTDRKIGCHSKCERYKQFREEIELIHKNKRLEHLKDTVEMLRTFGKRQAMLMRKKAGRK
jgi:hypothetical protein